ncbi:protein extra-macrochaetae isoform X1 [Drosophila subpulchrella]|uniref:protein extra-macrochaetae isoform X1 n=1 Tax=Drosophila subpulchrella TaxID=1486046 RepID=UPI0018A17AA1|nr:protein extra-macrochaetae isoform X1 [Drosophila subpulchrella]
MKSLTAVCQTGASGMPALNASGRISRHPTHRGDGENAEMKMYLSKLKDLVPFMPKNRKLTKLEIIQHVIDYICDLQTELETHPEMGNFDAAAALTAVNGLHEDEDSDMEDADVEAAEAAAAAETEVDPDVLAQRLAAEQPAKVSSPAARLPLADRQTPNTLVAPAHPQQQQQLQLQLQQQQLQSQQQLSNSLATPLNAEKDSRQS